MSRAISRALLRVGCEVVAVPSCLAVRALACRFDAGVFDVGLSDGCGIELARTLLDARQVDAVVFFTGDLTPATLSRARRLGPVVKKTEGAEALGPVVTGLTNAVSARPSGIVFKSDPETNDESPPASGAHGAA